MEALIIFQCLWFQRSVSNNSNEHQLLTRVSIETLNPIWRNMGVEGARKVKLTLLILVVGQWFFKSSV